MSRALRTRLFSDEKLRANGDSSALSNAIAAGGGAILAKRVRGEGGQKVPAADFAGSSGLKAGDKLDAAEKKKSA